MTVQRVTKTLQILRKRYPQGGALEVGEPWHLLVLVVLSARTRDEQVLRLAPDLFTAFPSIEKLAAGSVAQIRSKLSGIGLLNAKAKHLKLLAQKLLRDFDGRVPSTMEGLTSLPGVGRKTASVVLAAAFDIPAIAVDTHVHRVANRLGWVKTTAPEKTERQLLRLVPPAQQKIVNQVMVPFGRSICTPGTPRCWACPVRDLCAYKKKHLTPPPNAEKILEQIKEREEHVLQRTAAVAAKIPRYRSG